MIWNFKGEIKQVSITEYTGTIYFEVHAFI